MKQTINKKKGLGSALAVGLIAMCLGASARARSQPEPASASPPRGRATGDATASASTSPAPGRPTGDATAPASTSPAPGRPTGDATGVGDEEQVFPPPKDPFAPPKKARQEPRLWFLNVEFGVAVPLNADKGMPDAGVFVALRGGRRLFRSGSVSLWVGLDVTMDSLRKEDEVVLNPNAAPESQVKCEDDKGLTLWTLRATLGLEWLWKRLAFRVVGFGGGGFAEYTQLNRVPATDSNGDPVLECTFDELDAWLPVAGGWIRGGWMFSPKAEAGLVVGAMAVISSKKLTYDVPEGGTRTVDVLPHLFHAGAYFTHRF